MLGERIRKLRKEFDLTQEELGKKVGVSTSMIGMYETNKRNPGYENLEKIADCFNVSTDYLLGRSDKRLPYDISNQIDNYKVKENPTSRIVEKIKNKEIDYAKAIRESCKKEKPSVRTARAILSDLTRDYLLYTKDDDDYYNDLRWRMCLKADEYVQENFTDSEISDLIEKAYKESEIQTNEITQIPVLGYISAGNPLLAEEHIIDYEMIPSNQVKGGDYFYLKVRGDSMIDAGINNGDLVLVRKQSDINNNEIAVVMVNGHDATVKRVQKEYNEIKLIPENENYKPIVIRDDSAKIIGKVVALTRRF